MEFRHRHPILYRVIPVILLVLLVMPQFALVFADPVTTSDSAGTSLYAVTTALTAFANNVIGANTNDKHADLASGGGTVDKSKSHRLWELSTQAGRTAAGKTYFAEAGDAGAIVGYGDSGRGFVSSISANETHSVTTSGYGAYVGIGDDERTYVYVRYGRLLNDLGIDSVANPANADLGRTIGGRSIQVAHMLSSFVPTAFDFSIQALKILNPFRFLVSDVKVKNVIGGENGSRRKVVGNLTDPWNGTTSNLTINVGTVNGHSINGVDEFGSNLVNPNVSESGLKKISDFTTELYIRIRNIGIFIIIPFTAVLLIAYILLTRGNQKGSRILNFVKKVAFIVIGIPLLGILYTATLDEIQADIIENSPSSRVIAATFVDFENWAKVTRLDPPAKGHLVSEGISEGEPQGRADGTSWRTVRDTIYQINSGLSIYNALPDGSGLGLHAGSGVDADGVMMNAGMWDENGEFTEFGSNAAIRRVIFTQMNSLLNAYAGRSFYTAAAWESNVNHALSVGYQDDLGQSQATDPASSNKATIYQMYFDTDEVDDWMDRYAEENAVIFDSRRDNVDDVEAAVWANKKWNIFSNGTRLIGGWKDDGTDVTDAEFTAATTTTKDMPSLYSHGTSKITETATLIYAHDKSVDWVSSNGMDPKFLGGLSTVAMYNYLSTAFNQTNIAVYSSVNVTSEYVRYQHYSVNIAGSGFISVLFGLNAFLTLGIFVILGIWYCFGMLFHNLKMGFRMLMEIPGAMLGVAKSIAQVVVYVLSMIVQLLATVFLYQVVTELVLVIASAIETPVLEQVSDVTATASVGGIFAFMQRSQLLMTMMNCRPLFTFGLGVVVVSLLGVSVTMTKMRRPVLMAIAYANCKVLRFVTCPALQPAFDKTVQKSSLYVWDDLARGVDKAACAVENLVIANRQQAEAQKEGVCV